MKTSLPWMRRIHIRNSMKKHCNKNKKKRNYFKNIFKLNNHNMYFKNCLKSFMAYLPKARKAKIFSNQPTNNPPKTKKAK